MSEEKSDFIELISDFKDYLKTRYQLTVLQVSEKGAIVLSNVLVYTLITITFLFILLFGSLALALYFAEIYHSLYIGFLIVASIYFGLFIMFILFKNLLINNVFVNMIIRKLFKNAE